MVDDKLISTIIPTYKRSDTLIRAINSVLNQNYRNIEVLVVDDNDEFSMGRIETEKMMDQFSNDPKVKYIKHKKNMNGANARNTGIKHANGEYITFLDDDDEFVPSRFETLIPILESSTEDFGLICSGYRKIHSNIPLKPRTVSLPDDIITTLLSDNLSIGSGSNFILKKEVISKVGGFDPEFFRHQDFEFLVRVAEKFKFLTSNQILLKIYTDSQQNNSQTINKLIQTKKQYLKKYSYLVDERNIDEIIKNQLESVLFQILIEDVENDYPEIIQLYKKKNNKIWRLYFKAKLYKIIRKIWNDIKKIELNK